MSIVKPRWWVEANEIRTNDQRKAVCDWLRAHQINADYVRRAEVRGWRLHIWEYKVNDQGHRYLDHGQPAERHFTVRLRREPPILELP